MKTLVIGHLRPDLDSIASAVAYAEFLRRNDREAEAGRSGPLDEQSQWALERFGIDAPKLVLDVAPTFPVRGTSRLMACGEHRLMCRLPYSSGADGLLHAPGVVSRKKQLVPSVLAGLES